MKTPIEKAQGHWVLAGMGKRVLRPGGKELTLRLMEGLQIGLADEVIEFAPGLGFTASIALKAKPKSYTGVELNKEAVAYLQNIIQGPNYRIQAGNANATGLPDESATKVYGEAMLTMQSARQKTDIIREAYRLLKKGGLYGIHEIALTAEGSDPAIRQQIYREMQGAILSNVAPCRQPNGNSC